MSTTAAPVHPRRRIWLVLGVGLAVTLAGGACLWSTVEKVRDAADRAHCTLLHLALGLHAYHEEHGLLRTLVGRGSDVAFSPDGRLLATGEDRGVVKLWDVHKLQQTKPGP